VFSHVLYCAIVLLHITGSSPHTFPDLSAGRHRLKIVPDGCGEHRRPVTTTFVM